VRHNQHLPASVKLQSLLRKENRSTEIGVRVRVSLRRIFIRPYEAGARGESVAIAYGCSYIRGWPPWAPWDGQNCLEHVRTGQVFVDLINTTVRGWGAGCVGGDRRRLVLHSRVAPMGAVGRRRPELNNYKYDRTVPTRLGRGVCRWRSHTAAAQRTTVRSRVLCAPPCTGAVGRPELSRARSNGAGFCGFDRKQLKIQ
jgi:hypothetical protein